MTFHADAYVPQVPAYSDVEAAAPLQVVDDDACIVRLTPSHGGKERSVRVRYALYGAAGAPVIVVQGGISATRFAGAVNGQTGWWDALVGADCAVDTRRYRALSIEWLERSDIASANDHDVRAIGSEDQAAAIAALLPKLGI